MLYINQEEKTDGYKETGTGIDCCKRICLYAVFTFQGRSCTSYKGWRDTGCNIENAAFTPTNCAERTAFFKAVSEGKKEFTAIAINGDANDYLYPCGVCRQVMAEFCDPETFQVILVNTPDDFKIFTLEELLPGAFTKQDITKATGKEL